MDLLMFSLVMFFALFVTCTNGFHDTANAIATVVGTKVLTPRQAVLLAAVNNLIGAFFGLAVAKTISSGIVEGSFIARPVLVCALVAGILWNLRTWWYGIPSSSSHALVGSLVGAALGAAICMSEVKPLADKDGRPVSVWSSIKWVEVKAKKEKKLAAEEPASEVLVALGDRLHVNGTHVVEIGGKKVQVVAFEGRVREVIEKEKVDKAGIDYKVVIPMINLPLSGFAVGLCVMGLLYAILPGWLQFGSMPAPVEMKSQGLPAWVVVMCALTMGLATAAAGWRIIKTMGHKMVKLQPMHGFAAETTAV